MRESFSTPETVPFWDLPAYIEIAERSGLDASEEPIVLTPDYEGQVRVLAELVEVPGRGIEPGCLGQNFPGRCAEDVDGSARDTDSRRHWPLSIPSALRSSSMSGQCTPSPLPMISKFERCSGVASSSCQDHHSGTEITRPSISVAVMLLLSTRIDSIRGFDLLAMLIPCLKDSASIPRQA